MMTMKTRAASKAEKETSRLTPNGKEKIKYEEEANVDLSMEDMLNNKKEEQYPPLLQKYKDGELTNKKFKEGVAEIRSTLIKMAEEMKLIANKVDENTKTQVKNLETLKIDVLVKFEDINQDFEEMEKENKCLVKDTHQTRQTTNSNTYDVKNLQKTVETHSNKINAANLYGTGGVWSLRSDEDAYPILKKDKNNHWSKFNANLKEIKLEGDFASAATEILAYDGHGIYINTKV